MTNQILEAIERLEAKIDALGANRSAPSTDEPLTVAEINEPKPCTKCGALIVWHKTRKGKNMALEASPTPDGDFKSVLGIASQYKEPYDEGERRFASHFNCKGKVTTSASDEPTVASAPTREPGEDDIPF